MPIALALIFLLLLFTQRWFQAIRERPAVQRGMAVGKDLSKPTMDEEARKILFGQKAR